MNNANEPDRKYIVPEMNEITSRFSPVTDRKFCKLTEKQQQLVSGKAYLMA